MSKGDDSYDLNLIGIKLRVEEVERLLNEKQIVGIWGMGGIGKTTIAQEGTENVEAISFRPCGTAHLLGQKVTLLMAGGEVPECMRGLIDFPEFEVDFICESGNRRERNAFNLFSDKDVANWNGYYGGLYLSDSSHVLLSFNGLRTRFDEECFVKASFCFNADCYEDLQEIMECGVHPIQ
ncbi:hypothetical protein GH714_021971 [Hevea brasiliensis]|uniref:NB-ARC domain-containing protein n=1 Tax=Hevea brasiliensis TaxID=3981 RepID=A0A6A6N644_HEVBR|nr:hypothetical protein GH714_021971 [Hevea brasiliensis]